ncbi:MAG: serine/threonine-protein kinase [Planctomycetota bacterium]
MTEPTDDLPLSPRPDEPADAPLVVAAFLARYLADREVSALKGREAYQALFPGFADVVGAEFDRLQAGEGAVPERIEGERLGPYRIERELGRGGQGIVYLAQDERLDRRVALKVLPGAFSATVARQRLLREAQAASRLDDPGICTVYDAGEQDGVAWIAMRYVDGDSVAERIAHERRLVAAGELQLASPERVASVLGAFEQVLRSLHRAHQKGLVHRDLKPGNLMLGADGQPRILDFGLAAFDDHPDGSLTGEVAIGTPAYMSPEQLEAREGRVDARSDVFSLAVTLYEALSLEHPFAAPTRERLYQHILRDDPAPLRSRVPGLPKDLDVVLQCALSKDRARRYADAAAFADDIGAVQRGAPIRARRVGSVERLRWWARRNPKVAALAAALLVATLAFVAVLALQNRELEVALVNERSARNDAAQALAGEQDARQRFEGLYLAGAATSELDRDPELALLLARAASERLDDAQTRGALLAALERYRPRPFVDGVDDAKWVTMAADGSRCAVGGKDRVLLVDCARAAVVATIELSGGDTSDVFWSPDGAQLVLAERNRLLQLGADGSVEAEVPVTLRDGTTGAVLAQLPGHIGKLAGVDFDARWVLTFDAPADYDVDRRNPDLATSPRSTVRVFSRQDGTLAHALGEHALGVVDARFLGNERASGWPDFESLSRAGVYRRVLGTKGSVLDERRVLPSGEPEFRLPELLLGQPGRVYVDDGDLLQCFAARTDEAPVRRKLPHGPLWRHPEAMLVSRVGVDPQRVELIDPVELTRLRALPTPPKPIVALLPGRRVAFRGSLFPHTRTTVHRPTLIGVFADGSLRIWSIVDEGFVDLPPSGGGAVAAAASREGDVVALVTRDGQLRLFDPDGKSALPELTGVQTGEWPALHPDGTRLLAIVGRDRDAVLFDLASGRELWRREPDEGWFTSGAWSPDGRLCAVPDDRGAVHVLRVEDGETVFTVPAADGEGERITQVVFDEAGRQLAVVREHVAIWDVAAQQEAHRFHDVQMARSVAFARGGSRIVLAHTTSHQLRALPGGELVTGSAGAANGDPWRLGVPCDVVGGTVLLARWHERPHSRVGGFAEAWLLDADTGDVQELAGGPFGRGALSPDGAVVVLPKADGSLLLLDRAGACAPRELHGHERSVDRVIYSADGAVFATGWASNDFAGAQDERQVCVWSRDGTLLQRLAFEPRGVAWLDLAADGRWVVVLDNDGNLRRWPVQPSALCAELPLREPSEAERARFGLR